MAANEQGVPATCGGVVLLQFVKSLTMSRTKTNVNPPAAVSQLREGHDARTRHAAKSTFCDRYHIVSATAELISYPSIDTACAVLTFDVPPKLSPANAGLSLRPLPAACGRILQTTASY
jgi:hypothetical protein